MPPEWAQLYNLLTETRQERRKESKPAAPLILAAWDCTMPIEKRLRLKEHLLWAADHGLLEQLATFLRALPEDKWAHFGEL